MKRVNYYKNFLSVFDMDTGEYIRTGILEKQNKYARDLWDTGVDPFMATFPELLDVGIMGHCKHGVSGLCVKAGVECYQDGLHSSKPNMTLEDFKEIVNQCKKHTYQIALGGCGDPDQHENFEEILKVCRDANIVPNFTTSGLGMTQELAALCKKYCGAVAVSWYRSAYTDKAIVELVNAGVKTNVHYVLSKSTVEEALGRLKACVSDDEFLKDSMEEVDYSKGFGQGINAVIFLLHKPVGLGTKEEMITAENEVFWELLAYINEHDFPFKIGFDSCTVPALLSLDKVNEDAIDTCEGGRWSAYISADMKMMPCSFDNQKERWAVSLREKSVQEAWDSEQFEDFRNHFKKQCPDCEKRGQCMGGCPIVPEIVVCKP